ncbi:c-type cytochrome [Vibrio sp.]|nr:c-type cytochrome [Vibrio sp.]
MSFGVTQAETELPDRQAELPAVEKNQEHKYLKPRSLTTIGNSEFGQKVKYGYSLFVDSQQMRGKFVGNEQNCVNCHMEAGRKANAAPLWGAFMAYPAYRKKNDKVNSYAERIQGCFTYSMNGKAPDEISPEMVALAAYSYWLAMSGLMDKHGLEAEPVPEVAIKDILEGGKSESFPFPDKIKQALPVDERSKLAGRGYPKIPNPPKEPSPQRGENIYKENCATCHAADGLGLHDADGYAYIPPLWGPQAYNWGAGMHRVNTAAYFIYENMPLGKSIQLSQQDAWDVASYINSHERPQDPRFKGNLKETAGKYHNHQGYYNKDPHGAGKPLGSSAY